MSKNHLINPIDRYEKDPKTPTPMRGMINDNTMN